MGLTDKFEKLVTKSVFNGGFSVFANDMSTASITISEQSRQENVLVAQGLKRHDAELLDQLILQYQHRLLRYLLFLTSNREIAEDLFQETWMRVLMRGAQFNGNSRFDTWLFTIARNLVIDMRRKRSMVSLEDLCESNGEERPIEFASSDPTPYDFYQKLENSKLVTEALLSLDPLHREVLTLRFHEELSLEEIAQVTHAPLSTVKSRLYRGLAALKPRIEAVTRLQDHTAEAL